MLALLHLWNITTAILFLAFFQSRLKYIDEKRQQNVVVGFVFAGLISVGLVLFLYHAYPPGLERTFSRSEFLYHTLVVGMVEETGKFLAFLFLLHTIGNMKEPQDGVIFGAIVGLTFGVIENMSYFSWYRTWHLLVRPVLTTGGHAIYGAIWGGLYSQALYANRDDDDPRARRSAYIGIPIVAILHGWYNAATWFLPLALVSDLISFLVALTLFRRLVELSPYRVYPLEQAHLAVKTIRRGLVFNPWSPTLNRNIGLYLIHLEKFRSAVYYLRRSIPRSRDPRRARFLAAVCETLYTPRFHAHRGLRIAWTRLSDEQRIQYRNQLVRLVGPDHPVVANLDEFIDTAFKPKTYKTTREIARDAKIKRYETRRALKGPRRA